MDCEKTKNQIILFSMPNSGSDWLATIISNGNQQIKYFREFFNPITNDKYIDELALGFGCEFISTYKNIAKLNNSICEEIYNKTWEKEKYNFTKENYSVFKIPFFIKKFNCIALTRKIENSFPPSRKNQVYWWYDCIYNSMIENIDTLPRKIKINLEITRKNIHLIEQKILMCHQIYQEALIYYCKEYEIPIIEWELLMGDEKEVIKELKKIPYDLDIEIMKNLTINTKKYKTRNFKKYKFDPKKYLEKHHAYQLPLT